MTPSKPKTPAGLLDLLFTTEAMRAVFSDNGRFQGMLDFEAALASALDHAGVTPGPCATAIRRQCEAGHFDFEALAAETAISGNIAIPMVKALTALVEKDDPRAAAFVHWGATSQDAIDTGTVLQLRTALDLIERGIADLCGGIVRLAKEHRMTLLPGRTWLQQGPPVTLGLKAAGWLDAMDRHWQRLLELKKRALVLQFGGAVGTLAALGDHGEEVTHALAEELNLGSPGIPWHSHRDRLAEAATTLGLLAGTLGKIARDVSLMAQTEVDEAQEPAAQGRGGSSTMPHKRNPLGAAVALAAAIRVPPLVSAMLAALVQEHERGLGGWHAEWETLPEICMLTAGSLARMAEVVRGLEVDAGRMAENLTLTHGLAMSESVSFKLAARMGKAPAHRVVEEASHRAAQEGRPLQDVLAENASVQEQLSAAEIAHALDPRHHLGSADRMVTNVLLAHESMLRGFGAK